MKIGVVGLGYVGLPLSSLLARNFEVVGFDNDESKVENIKAGIEVVSEPGLSDLLSTVLKSKKLILTSSPQDLKESEVKVITVGTPYDLKSEEVDFSQLDSSLDLIGGAVKPGDTIILKSTVPPGTTEGRVRNKLESMGYRVPSQVGLVFSPERMIEGQAIKDFKSLPKIIGATDDKSREIAKNILSTLGGTLIDVSSPTTAEMVKMIDNYSRFVFLGLTNEIALMAEKVGVDVIELINAAKEDYPRNAGLLKPGPGVGGSCLNKDPFILESFMKSQNLYLKMVESAKSINYGMAAHVSELTTQFSSSGERVAILGVAFKGDTNDTRFTTTFEVQHRLEEKGLKVVLSDPFVKPSGDGIVPDKYNAIKGANVLLLMTDHSEYEEIDLEKARGLMSKNPVIIDMRALIDRKAAEKYGFEYHGLGRI